MSSLYAKYNSNNPLSGCKKSSNSLKENDFISYCDINEKELNYFDDYSPQIENKMINRVLCGSYVFIDLVVYKLDKNQYPIFRVKYFYYTDFTLFNIPAVTSLIVDIEGSVSGCTSQKPSSFFVPILVETNKQNNSNIIVCSFQNLKKTGPNYQIICPVFSLSNIQYDNVYLLPYYGILDFVFPFEVIIKEEMKGDYFLPQDKIDASKMTLFHLNILILLIDLLI